MARLFKRKRAKKQAEELAKKTALIELRDRNRAKREAKLKAIQAAAKAKGPGMSGLASEDEIAKKQAEMKKFKEESKAAEIRTKRGKSNIRSRASVGFGEAYERVEADGTVRKLIKKDPSKKSQPKPAMDQSASNVKSQKEKAGEYSRVQYGKEKKNYKSKPGESLAAFRKRIKPEMEKNRAKHGGALAIMIAPVKTKKMKAVKKAPGGAAMKKMPSYKKGGALKSVPSDAKGLAKLPTSVRNKMGYMKNGGKVKKRTTTVKENTPSRYSKFTDAQKAQLKSRGERLKGEDKKDFDYDVARSKDTKSKTTTTTKRRSGKVKSQSVTEKRKSSIPGRSTDVTTASKKRRGGSTRVKTTSYGAGDDRDAGRVVKQKFSKKGKLKKTKVISNKKAIYGAKMKN